MNIEHDSPFANGNAGAICFGLDRATDERSLILFLKRFCDERLLTALVPRLQAEEIDQVVDLVSGLLRAHLTDEEYHALFLEDSPGTEQRP